MGGLLSKMVTEKTKEQRNKLRNCLDRIVGNFEIISRVMEDSPRAATSGIKAAQRYRALDNRGKSNVMLFEDDNMISVEYQSGNQEYLIEISRSKLK